MPEPRTQYILEVRGPGNRALTQLKTDDAEEAVKQLFDIIDEAERNGTIMPFQAKRLMEMTAAAFAGGQNSVSFILGTEVVGLTRTTSATN